jgi:hypothetical protein
MVARQSEYAMVRKWGKTTNSDRGLVKFHSNYGYRRLPRNCCETQQLCRKLQRGIGFGHWNRAGRVAPGSWVLL